MVDPKRPGEDGGEPAPGDDADLSARLKRLDSRLGEFSAGRVDARKPQARKSSDMGAIGQALRLSAEFISGVIAGGMVGWLLDRWLGTSPWALFVCLLLGFGAGMLNMLRASGELQRSATSASSPGVTDRSESDG